MLNTESLAPIVTVDWSIISDDKELDVRWRASWTTLLAGGNPHD